MGALEVHPIDARHLLVGLQPLEAVVDATVLGISRIALRHDDEIRVELVLHVDRRAITPDRLVEWNHGDTCALGAALALDGLVVDAHAGNAGTDAFSHHAPHRHDAAVAGIA